MIFQVIVFFQNLFSYLANPIVFLISLMCFVFFVILYLASKIMGKNSYAGKEFQVFRELFKGALFSSLVSFFFISISMSMIIYKDIPRGSYMDLSIYMKSGHSKNVFVKGSFLDDHVFLKLPADKVPEMKKLIKNSLMDKYISFAELSYLKIQSRKLNK